VTKPPYRVPLMDEVRALPWNGLRVASTFAGGGGSSTGYRMAGFKVVYANEFVPAAADTYRANAHPDTIVDTTDIRQVTAAQILTATGLTVGELDVLDGSPPCASFSTAGKKSAKWGQVAAYSDTTQRTDDLFYEFARLLKDLQPRVFVAENVSGLVKGVAKGYFKAILTALRDCGYQVSAKLLDAAWLGVPQARQRLIFVGVRNDIPYPPTHPKPMPYQYTVRDALPWLSHQAASTPDGGGFSEGDWRPTDHPSPTVGTHPYSGNGRCPPSFVRAELVSSAADGDWGAGRPRIRSEHNLDAPGPTVMAAGIAGGGPHQTAIVVHETGGQPQYSAGDVTDRVAATIMTTPSHFQVIHDTSGNRSAGEVTDRPSPTITVGVNSLNSQHIQLHTGDPAGLDCVDPETGQDLHLPASSILRHGSATARKLTLGELRALCSFPPDYTLTGSYGQRWERLGRSVPPLMMRAVAAAIRDEILAPSSVG
jgi:DNA (cytosine-5)-methyltransferase 1